MSKASDAVAQVMDDYIAYYTSAKGVPPPVIHLSKRGLDTLET